METHLLVLGVPLLLVIVLGLLLLTRKGPHPQSYDLSEKWTHPPILWAATDESVGDAHGEPEFTVGGGASGTW
jgi:hypothetical protein